MGKLPFKHTNNKKYNWLVYKIMNKHLIKYSSIYKGKLYDFGCGDSPYKDLFLLYAEQYIGVDWSNSLHDLKAEIVSDLNKPLPILSETADTIVSISVLEHLYDPQMMINEAYRILKVNGNLLLQIPWQWRVHEAPYDYHRFTPFALKMILEKAGFKSFSIEPAAGFFTTFFLKFNYFTARFVPEKGILGAIMSVGFIPLWYINLKLAPVLDRFDKDWSLETISYYVVAKKE